MWLFDVFSQEEGYYHDLWIDIDRKGMIRLILLGLFLILCILGAFEMIGPYLAYPFCMFLAALLIKLMLGSNEDSRLALELMLQPMKLYAWMAVIWTYERLSMADEVPHDLILFCSAWLVVGYLYISRSFLIIIDPLKEWKTVPLVMFSSVMLLFLLLYPCVFSNMYLLPYNGFTHEHFKVVRILFLIVFIIAGIGLIAFIVAERESLLSSLPCDLILTAAGVIPLVIVRLLQGIPDILRGLLLFLLYGIAGFLFHRLRGAHYGRTICLLLPFVACMFCSFMHSSYALQPLVPVPAMYQIYQFMTGSAVSDGMASLVQPALDGLCGVFSGLTNCVLKLYGLITENVISDVRVPSAVGGILGMVVSVILVGLSEVAEARFSKRSE